MTSSDRHPMAMPFSLVFLCLLLVIGGLVTYFFKPTPGFAVMTVGVILYLVLVLARVH